MYVTPKCKAGVWASAKPRTSLSDNPKTLFAFKGKGKVIATVVAHIKYRERGEVYEYTHTNLMVRTVTGVGWVGAGAVVEC